MSNPTRITGRITIIPPLTWPEFRNGPLYNPAYVKSEVRFDVTEDIVETLDGQAIRRTAAGLVSSTEERFTPHYLVEHVQAAIDALPGREFGGRLECDSEDGGLWRVEVHDHQAVMVEPQIMWPEDEAKFEAAALIKAAEWFDRFDIVSAEQLRRMAARATGDES